MPTAGTRCRAITGPGAPSTPPTARIAGVIPPYGKHQEYVYLPHSDLRARHDRSRVTDVQLPFAPDARSVSLRVAIEAEGTDVGSFEASTTGGLIFHPTSDLLGRRQRAGTRRRCLIPRVRQDAAESFFCVRGGYAK
jgi:hypothetical protein